MEAALCAMGALLGGGSELSCLCVGQKCLLGALLCSRDAALSIVPLIPCGRRALCVLAVMQSSAAPRCSPTALLVASPLGPAGRKGEVGEVPALCLGLSASSPGPWVTLGPSLPRLRHKAQPSVWCPRMGTLRPLRFLHPCRPSVPRIRRSPVLLCDLGGVSSVLYRCRNPMV